MPTNEEKKQPSAASKLLDALCRALGIYKKDATDPTKVDYQFDWFPSPLVKSKENLANHAHQPIIDALLAVLKKDPPVESNDLPLILRVHETLPLWLMVLRPGNTGPLEFDLLSQYPIPTATTPLDKPIFGARANLVKLVAGGQTIAELRKPVELAMMLQLARRPPQLPSNGNNLPIFAGFGLRWEQKWEAPTETRLKLDIIDSSHLSSSGPVTTADESKATRTVEWKAGDSLVIPLVHTTLLVLRAWVVQLAKKKEETHFSWRLYKHLFPLLEGIKGTGNTYTLPPFPLGVFAPDLSKLKPWLSGYLSPGAVLLGLYHLRALLTGKEDLKLGPGSSIAWFANRTNGNDFSKPEPTDFGLVVRTNGSVDNGSASIGLRGQACWFNTAKTVRMGLALEGDLLSAAWELLGDISLQGVHAGAKCKVSTGEVACFVVLETVDPAQTLVTVTGIGSLKRAEVGVRLRLGVMEAAVRVTGTNDVAQTLGQLSQQAKDVLAALPVPQPVRDAVFQPNPVAALQDAVIQWAKTELSAIGAQVSSLDLGGFAALNFGANDNSVRLQITQGAFGGPVQLSSASSIGISSTGVSCVVGLQAANDLGLPAPVALDFALNFNFASNVANPQLNLRYDTVVFPLLDPAVVVGQVEKIATGVLRPMLNGLVNDALNLDIVSGYKVRDLVELIGLKDGAWTPPSPEQVLDQAMRLTGIASPVAGSSPTMFNLVSNLEFADEELTLKFGAVKLGIFDSNGAIKPTIELANVELKPTGDTGKPLYSNDFMSLGKIGMGVGVQVYEPKLNYVEMQVHNLQLPLGSAGTGNAGLLPTGKENPGISVAVRYDTALHAKFLDGSQAITVPIDRVIGPIDVQRMRLSLPERDGVTFVEAKLDANFKMGGVEIAPQGLGVAVPLSNVADTTKWEATLDGLALSFHSSGVNLAGMLVRTGTGFVGQAAVDAFGFQLGALAAYDKIEPDKIASLVVFGVLDAMLGGPPFFVVTGVAAGFGVNRAFERPKRTADLPKNPLLATMQGTAMDMATFRASLAPKAGAYWLAAGVRFVSYGFIKGNALLYVLFDNGFELGLMAIAKMEIPSLACIQLAIEAGFSTRDEPTLYAKAALYDSWLLHKDCRLTGGFALQVWPNLGDAVITLGGYHPRFVKPTNREYPDVDRIGFRWALGSTISVKGECYFAMTPREAMGGGRLEVEGSWGPLAAGFHAAVDGLFRWDPFYFDVMIDVGIWIAIDTWIGRLRLSLGVGLHVWGPPVGGIATIDIAVITIDVPFGSDQSPNTAPLPVAKVLRDHLQVALPATAKENDSSVRWEAMNLLASDAKAPLRLSVLAGQASKEQSQTKLQLTSEFKVRVESALALTTLRTGSIDTEETLPPPHLPGMPPPAAAPKLYLTLAKQAISRSILIFDRSASWQKGTFRKIAKDRPLALLGPPDAAGGSGNMTIPVWVEIIWDMSAILPTALNVTKMEAERSLGDERCPLPLARAASTSLAHQAKALGTAGVWDLVALQNVAPALAAERAMSGRALPKKVVPMSTMGAVRSARFYRDFVSSRKRPPRLPFAVVRPPQVVELAYLELPTATVAWAGRTSVDPGYAGEPRVTPPLRTPRSVLIAGVELHAVTPRARNVVPSPAPLATKTAQTVLGKLPRSTKAPAGPARRKQLMIDAGAFPGKGAPHFADLDTGQLCVFDLARPGTQPTTLWKLRAGGGQNLRVIALDALDRPVDDFDLPAGEQECQLPAGTRRLALVGLGVGPFEMPTPTGFGPFTVEIQLPPPPPAPPIGFGPSTALVGVGARTFIGPGCVIVAAEGPTPQRTPLGTMTAGKLVERLSRIDVRMRPSHGVLVLQLQPKDVNANPRGFACSIGGEIIQPFKAHVRGNCLAFAFQVPTGALDISLLVRTDLRLLGISRWPGRGDLPAEVFDVPIHHSIRRHSDATRFRLEVLP